MKIFSFTLPLAVGGLAAWLTMGSMSQYAALVQPPLAPPAWIFPIAWTILYVLMGWASLRVRQSGSPERSNALALYYTQLAVRKRRDRRDRQQPQGSLRLRPAR